MNLPLQLVLMSLHSQDKRYHTHTIYVFVTSQILRMLTYHQNVECQQVQLLSRHNYQNYENHSPWQQIYLKYDQSFE